MRNNVTNSEFSVVIHKEGYQQAIDSALTTYPGYTNVSAVWERETALVPSRTTVATEVKIRSFDVAKIVQH